MRIQCARVILSPLSSPDQIYRRSSAVCVLRHSVQIAHGGVGVLVPPPVRGAYTDGSLSRVTLTDYRGRILLDTFVRPT